MKVLKNILKWLLCVFLTYATIFTIMNFTETIEGIGIVNKKQSEDLYNQFFTEENIKYEEENMNAIFQNNDKLADLYNNYPAGTVYSMSMFSQMYLKGEIIIHSSILSIIIGTAIYLLITSRDKKGIKLVIVFYLLSFAILGFVQGVQNISGENLNILDYWIFPNEYIVPITIAFGLVIAVRIIKQKDLANKLNKKLKEKNK